MDASWCDAQQRLKRCSWLLHVRPQIMAALLGDILYGRSRRRRVQMPNGISLHLDPLTSFGATILSSGSYEPGAETVFRDNIKPGDNVLDVGANEGFFTVLAGHLTGRNGRVVAIEPQQRLVGTLRKNVAANDVSHYTIIEAALGEAHATAEMNLTPSINTGSSSLVQKYRWSRRKQKIDIVPPSVAFNGVSHFDFVKVDVEGYEPEVIAALMPYLERGQIGKLYVEYHPLVLVGRGIDQMAIHRSILAAGMRSPDQEPEGYHLYSRN